MKDAQGKPLLDAEGHYRADKIAGLHVMRREKDFGKAYGKNRTGEWEYVEYRADGSYITPPKRSFACAECHMKAGPRTGLRLPRKTPGREGPVRRRVVSTSGIPLFRIKPDGRYPERPAPLHQRRLFLGLGILASAILLIENPSA